MKRQQVVVQESKKKDRGRFWTAGFQGMERSAVHTFLQKCSPTLRIFGVFNAKTPEKSDMLAEKVVQKTKPTEECGRRAGERLQGGERPAAE